MKGRQQRPASVYEKNLQPEELGDRELLEHVLGCTNCRAHAKKTADALFSRFGSYRRILLSSREALLDVDGMTENAAELFCLLQNTYRKSMPQRVDFIDTYAGPMSSFIGKLMGHSLEEELWVAGFDSFGILRACDCIQRGTVSSIHTSIGLLAEYASRRKLNYLSVAHNHPEGGGISDDGADMEVLHQITNVLGAFGIRLLEYIVLDEELHIYTCGREPSGGELQQQSGEKPLQQLAEAVSSESKFEPFKNS